MIIIIIIIYSKRKKKRKENSVCVFSRTANNIAMWHCDDVLHNNIYLPALLVHFNYAL